MAIPLVGVAAYIGYMLLSFLSQHPTTGELFRFGFAVAIWCGCACAFVNAVC